MQVNNLASSVVGFKSKEKSGSFFLNMIHLLSCLNWTNQPFYGMYKMLCKMLCIFICCRVLHQFYVLGFEHELAKNFSFETLLVVVSNGTSSIQLWPTYGQLLQCHKSPRHFTPVLKKFYVSWLQPMRSKFFHISDIIDTTWTRSRLPHHREPKKNHRGTPPKAVRILFTPMVCCLAVFRRAGCIRGTRLWCVPWEANVLWRSFLCPVSAPQWHRVDCRDFFDAQRDNHRCTVDGRNPANHLGYISYINPCK